MDFEDFKYSFTDSVAKEIDRRGIEGINLKIDTLDSPDGVTERLMVSVNNSKMSMAFRLEDIYRDSDEGYLIDEMAERVVNTIESGISTIKSKESAAKDILSDYSKIKDHVYLRLIPGTSPILNETPHRMIEDMAVVANIRLDDFLSENSHSCVVVNDKLLELYGVDEAQILEDAERNSITKEPIVFAPLFDVVQKLIGEDVTDPEGPITYVASTESGFQGAAIAAYPDFLQSAAEKMNGSFYLIPSSVHEFLLIKDDGTQNAHSLNDMVRNVNENVLEARDYLSDQCYHYDAKCQKLETGIAYENRSRGRSI